jgi:hypothetical protein
LHDLLKGKGFTNSNPIGLTVLETMHAITKEFFESCYYPYGGGPESRWKLNDEICEKMSTTAAFRYGKERFSKTLVIGRPVFWNYQQNKQACSKKNFKNIFVCCLITFEIGNIETTSSSAESSDLFL